MSAAQRLEQVINYLEINAKAFSEELGYERPQIIYDILKGKTKSISENLAIKITSVYSGISRVWLLTGEGEMLKDTSPETPEVIEVPITEPTGNVIPLLPVEAIAGGLQFWSRTVELADCRKVVSPIPGADYAIQVSGDSMEPEIHNGTFVYIKKINERSFIPWGNTMVVDTENGVVVKKLFPVEHNADLILAKSVNPQYPPFKIPTESIYGIYRVLGGSFVVSTL